MADALIFKLMDIPPEGREYHVEVSADDLELPGDGGIVFVGRVNCHLRLERVPGTLLARGVLTVDARVPCARCAEVFATAVSEPSFETALETGPNDESADLTAEVRDFMVLAFPHHPLCSEGCKGLCPQCGRNLNEGACRCRPPKDTRWGALDGLVVGEK